MVGNFDHACPTGEVWTNTRAVLSGLRARIGRPLASILSFHRDYSPKSCPGNAITRDWVLSQVPEPWPLSATIHSSPDSPLLGPPSGLDTAAIVYLSARATQYEPGAIAEIVTAYRREGGAVGVDWFLALAQLAHETGSLTSWWCSRPRRNPAGLGVTGAKLHAPKELPPGLAWAWDGTVWREGLSFARWDPDAVRAHLGRLLAYALASGQGTPAQQAMIAYALTLRPLRAEYRGCAQTLADLEGRWAVPGTGYAARVAATANLMRQGGG
jgi:hypothetical protein